MNIGDNLWSGILKSLKEQFSETTVGLWFDNAEITSLDSESVMFTAADDFKLSIIEKKYLPVLEKLFEESLGFPVEVRVESAASTNDEKSEENLFIKSTSPVFRQSQQPQQTQEARAPGSRTDYTFDNFVVGSSNQLAQAAAFAVAQHPAELYNPLFLFGPSGLGKTHLLFAIMNEVKRLYPSFSILYVTSEEFTNELIDALALKQNKNMAFKEKYRNVDLLLVDDVHFIAGKYAVQEEFFHTFNALYNERKQIILTSDRPPKDINYLEERLKSRFESGLMADIQPPDAELRAAIFKMKTKQLGIQLDNDVLNYLSEKITNNVRQIEGALKRLRAQSFITGEPITLMMADEVLADYFRDNENAKITIEKIFSFISKRYGVSAEEIKSKKRTSDIVYVRHIAMYLCTEYAGMSLKAIGRQFGRDHSTVISARDNVLNRMKKDASFDKEIKELVKELTTA